MNENQNLSAEYLVLFEMTQKEESIKAGIEKFKSKILVSAGEEFESWPKEKQDKFFERTIIAIAKDEKLTDCFQSIEGKLSVIAAIEKSIATGLLIGGVHAYCVPQPKKVTRQGKEAWVTEIRFSIRDRGYYALLCGGKRPIFLDLRWGQVYEKDQCSINKGTGEVKHEVCISGDKGKFLGCWVQAKKINGQLEAEFYSSSKIDQWRNSSKAFLKLPDSPWKTWPEEMALEASIRHFCDRYEQARELLASAIYDDDQPETEKEKSSIDIVNDAVTKPETEEKKETEQKKEEKGKSDSDGQLELF